MDWDGFFYWIHWEGLVALNCLGSCINLFDWVLRLEADIIF